MVRIIGGTIALLLYAFLTCTMTTLLRHSLEFYVLFDKLKRYFANIDKISADLIVVRTESLSS